MKIIIHTSNGYTHVALTNAFLISKNWPGHEIVVLGYEEILLLKEIKLPQNVKYVCLGKQADFGKTWSTAMIPYFNQLEDDYFVLVPDDCILVKKIDISKVNFLEDLVRNKSADKAVLGGGLSLKDTVVHAHDQRLLIYHQNIPYRSSIIPAIWSKKYFLHYLVPNITTHEFEAKPNEWKAANDGAIIINYNTGPNPENPHLFCFVNTYHTGKITINKDLSMTCGCPPKPCRHYPQYGHYSKKSLRFILDDVEKNKRKFEKLKSDIPLNIRLKQHLSQEL